MVSALIKRLIFSVPVHWATKEMELIASVSMLFTLFSVLHRYPAASVSQGQWLFTGTIDRLGLTFYGFLTACERSKDERKSHVVRE